MNLLTDGWLPVLDNKQSRQISLQDVLCVDADWEISLPRDDMELAALQLLVCLAQVLFPVESQADLRARIKTPLTEADYRQAIEPYRDWFDLDHPRTPFMQSRGVAAKEVTPIQKLFVGLPEGNNHSFFNAEGEIGRVCGGCAVIALFNQAGNAPNFGGGFKGSLRGGAPVTTLIDAPSLRRRVWENVLPATEVRRLLPEFGSQAEERPVWVEPIVANKPFPAADIGLLRGLFWQPARVELLAVEAGRCDHCGHETSQNYAGFYKEKFGYQLEGVWPHPHSPRQWEEKQGERHVRFVSFTTKAPAWTQLTQFLLANEESKEGYVPAAVVSSRRQRRSGGRLQLLVGGYLNKQASILERRHELFSFAPGWEDGAEYLADVVDLGLRVAKLLRGSLYWAVKGQNDRFKGIGVPIHDPAEQAFYRRSQGLIHAALQEMDYEAYQQLRFALIEQLGALARTLYQEAVAPYLHDSELVHAIAAGRSRLNSGLQKLKKEESGV